MGTYYKKAGDWLWLVETPAHSEGEWYDKGNLGYPPNPPYGFHTPSGHSMAYDANRRIIVYQEKPFYFYYPGNSTWEYSPDTNTWVRVFSVSPGPQNARGRNPMCYDGVNRVVVMLQPRYGVTHFWRWDGVGWVDIFSAIAGWPPSIIYPYGSTISYHLVWDESRQMIWFISMSAGYKGSIEIGLIDTSVFAYLPLYSGPVLPGMPPLRHGHGVAYDPVNQGILLSHGLDPNYGYGNEFDDTWLLTESGGTPTWTEVAGSGIGGTYPPPRVSGNMATGPHGVYMVSGFGGYPHYKFNVTQHDTWRWNGTSWSKLDYTLTMDLTESNMLVVGKYPLPVSEPLPPVPPPPIE